MYDFISLSMVSSWEVKGLAEKKSSFVSKVNRCDKEDLVVNGFSSYYMHHDSSMYACYMIPEMFNLQSAHRPPLSAVVHSMDLIKVPSLYFYFMGKKRNGCTCGWMLNSATSNTTLYQIGCSVKYLFGIYLLPFPPLFFVE